MKGRSYIGCFGCAWPGSIRAGVPDIRGALMDTVSRWASICCTSMVAKAGQEVGGAGVNVSGYAKVVAEAAAAAYDGAAAGLSRTWRTGDMDCLCSLAHGCSSSGEPGGCSARLACDCGTWVRKLSRYSDGSVALFRRRSSSDHPGLADSCAYCDRSRHRVAGAVVGADAGVGAAAAAAVAYLGQSSVHCCRLPCTCLVGASRGQSVRIVCRNDLSSRHRLVRTRSQICSSRSSDSSRTCTDQLEIRACTCRWSAARHHTCHLELHRFRVHVRPR